jgi:uncharacterized membrane protein YqgA involved in biofilm formation
MTGALINVAAILIGGMIGILFGARIPERMKETVVAGMGLFTAVMGIQMFLKTQNSMIVLGALVTGTLLGEWLGIENGLHALGQFLEQRFARDDAPGASNRFMRGFLTASLLYCIGPLAIVGSINDGLTGDYSLIAVKSVIDCFASIAFASSLGIGVLFSAVPVFMVQGGISFSTIQLSHFMSISASATDPKVLELTATGGIILFGLALGRLLEIKSIRVGNMLPALVVAPLIVWGLSRLAV